MQTSGEHEKSIEISGMKYRFTPNLNLNFLAWYKENKNSVSPEEISLKYIKNHQLNTNDIDISLLKDSDRVTILNEIAKEGNFDNVPISSYDEFVSGINLYLEEIQNEISKIFSEFMKRIKSAPEDLKKLHEVYGKEGWYIPPAVLLKISPRKVRELGNASKKKINQVMIELARKVETEILTEIKEYFNDRYIILKEALEAHKEGKYNLAIPVMLAQADGICKDVIDNNLFCKTNKIKKKLDYFKKPNQEIFNSIVFYPLENENALNIDSRNRDETFSQFNRHAILHGGDLYYGTIENSYRCIMLIKYLIEVKCSIEESNCC